MTKQPHITAELAHTLIARQFPDYAHLPVTDVEHQGHDNRTYRLGDEMLIRLPSAEEYALKVEKEQIWLPRLAPLLPLAIPTPLALEKPNENYLYPWSIYRWIEGNTAAFTPIVDKRSFAIHLAQFINALHYIDIADGPCPDFGDFSYIGGLTAYDNETRQAIKALENKIDADAATELWERALQTTWQRPPVWVHGDISAGNLLVQEGKLNAVIDFSGLAIGDPACDLVVAWKFLRGRTRGIFREMLPLDSETWARGRAWALWKSMIVAAGFTETNIVESSQAWPTIEEVIQDFKEL